MQAEPARCNRALDTDAVLIRRATGLEKCALISSMYTRPSRAAAVAFAISTSLRAAASGSVKGPGSTNLAGMMSSGRMRDVDDVD
jgi:hypothetical protein